MKVMLRLNVKQLQVIARSLNYSYLHDIGYDKDCPDTQELRHVLDKAVKGSAWPGDCKVKISVW